MCVAAVSISVEAIMESVVPIYEGAEIKEGKSRTQGDDFGK